MLKNPPRSVDENDLTTPMIPATIAIIAKSNPATAPVVKLQAAAATAISEKMLNAARGGGPVPSIPSNLAGPNPIATLGNLLRRRASYLQRVGNLRTVN